MHKCTTIDKAELFAFEDWPMKVLLITSVGPVLLTVLSRMFSRGRDKPWDLIVGLYSLAEAAAKGAFWVALW